MDGEWLSYTKLDNGGNERWSYTTPAGYKEAPEMSNEQYDVIDLIINTLREHEKVLDKLVTRLTFVLGEQTKLHKAELALLKSLLKEREG